jgi:hypothetical protein
MAAPYALAEAGLHGWEMVSFALNELQYVACFKRPLPPAAPAPGGTAPVSRASQNVKAAPP